LSGVEKQSAEFKGSRLEQLLIVRKKAQTGFANAVHHDSEGRWIIAFQAVETPKTAGAAI